MPEGCEGVILLNQPTQWAFLAVPPTHALLLWRHIGPAEVSAIYAFGNLDGDGNFIENQFTNLYRTPEKNEGFYRAPVQLREDMPNALGIHDALGNLLNAGVAPNPTNPTEAVSVPNKKAGEAKIVDFDAVFAFYVPELNGTVI